MSTAGAAASLTISVENVKVRYHRARALLGADLVRQLESNREEILCFGGARCDRMVATIACG